MLRTNTSFLSFIKTLHESKQRQADVQLKSFTKGTLLLEQGDMVSKVYIVETGITKCYFSEENGKRYILEFLGAGEIAGEIEVLKNIDCLCSVEAVTEISAYVLTVPFVRSLIENDLAFNQLLLAELSERIINTSSRSSAQQLYSIEHGLNRLLTLQQENGLSISKEDTAAYLGITVRSLNRLLAAK